MKNIVAIIFFALIASPAFSQSGIFLTTQCAKGMKKNTVMITNKQVCLAPNPLIAPTELNSITEVQTEAGKIWFDIVVSQKAVVVMSQISSNLPSAVFALVVDNEVFYTFPAIEITPNRTFRFQGTSREIGTFLQMQKRLHTLIEATAPEQ